MVNIVLLILLFTGINNILIYKNLYWQIIGKSQ